MGPPDPRLPCSGEPVPLRLRETAHHAGEDTHAGPEGRDAGDPLRELPHAVHPEHDPHGGEGEEPQVRGWQWGWAVGRDGAASLLPGVALGWPFPCWLEGLVGTLCPHGLWGQSRASSWCQGSALNAHQTRGTCIPFRIPRIPGVTPKSRCPTELAAEPSPAQCGGLAGGLSLAGGVVTGGSRGWLAVTMGALSSSLHACCGRRRQPSTLRLCCADCSAD